MFSIPYCIFFIKTLIQLNILCPGRTGGKKFFVNIVEIFGPFCISKEIHEIFDSFGNVDFLIKNISLVFRYQGLEFFKVFYC